MDGSAGDRLKYASIAKGKVVFLSVQSGQCVDKQAAPPKLQVFTNGEHGDQSAETGTHDERILSAG